MTRADPPPTRWEQTVTGQRGTSTSTGSPGSIADGTDLEGEARFVDVLARGGPGAGRRLRNRAHRRRAAPDGPSRDRRRSGRGLVAIAGRPVPGPAVPVGGPADADGGRACRQPVVRRFDVIVLAGNVHGLPRAGHRTAVLGYLTDLLVPDGRIVAGFATDRDYTVADLDRDAAAIGLTVEHRFATWHLDPWSPARTGRSSCSGGGVSPAATVD